MRRGLFVRAIGDDRGASALEFAILAVPLLLIIVGTIEYGRLLWTRQAMQSLAISTARCMGVLQPACTTTGVYSSTKSKALVVSEAAKLSVPLASTDVTVNASTTCGGISGFAKVSITYTFVSAAPEFIVQLLMGPTLHAEACFPNQS